MSHKPQKPRSFIGLVLIGAAILLLLNNIGFRLFGWILQFWPVLLIVAGVVLIAVKKEEQRSHGALPYFLVVAGGLLLMAQYRLFNLSFGAILIPMVLFFIGYNILRPNHMLGKRCGSRRSPEHRSGVSNSSEVENSDGGEDRIDIFAILGGGEYGTHSNNLTGGNVVCVMGGAEIDIREADTQNDVVELDILAIMGGAEIAVPPHWQVTVKVLPFLGGVSNQTTCLADKLGLPKKQLVITGFAFMGGIEVKN